MLQEAKAPSRENSGAFLPERLTSGCMKAIAAESYLFFERVSYDRGSAGLGEKPDSSHTHDKKK